MAVITHLRGLGSHVQKVGPVAETQQPTDTGSSRGTVRGTKGKYVGLTLLLAWHYSLWFVPSAFPTADLTDRRVTYSFLLALASASVVPLTISWRLGRRGQLAVTPGRVWTSALVGAVATLTLTSLGMQQGREWIAFLSSVLVGASAGVLWVMWGERLTFQGARFQLTRVAPTYGGFLLAMIGITAIAPGWVAPASMACLPLVSGFLLHRHLRVFAEGGARLLPAETAAGGTRAMLTVIFLSSIAALVCYYTVAIVPWSVVDHLPGGFTLGIVIGGVLILASPLVEWLLPGERSTFRVYPWLLMLVGVACVLYLADPGLQGSALLLALAISSMFEILLTLYMGTLTQRGYMSAVRAFAFSGSAIRLGTCAGNGMALVHKSFPGLHEVVVRPTFVLLVTLVTGLLITMVRQEYAIEELTQPASAKSELEQIVEQVAQEFQLSEREREVMALIGQGYTASAVAEQLVISINTVNTHIRNIYRKLGIHKRSELISYLRRNG